MNVEPRPFYTNDKDLISHYENYTEKFLQTTDAKLMTKKYRNLTTELAQKAAIKENGIALKPNMKMPDNWVLKYLIWFFICLGSKS